MIKINDTFIDENKISFITKYGYKSTDKKGLIIGIDGSSVNISARTLGERDSLYNSLNEHMYSTMPISEIRY